MDKVVLYCRVSTQVQDYERQVSDLTQFAKKHQWEIAETFTEKISGAKKNDERKELTSLLSYARVHYINRVLVTELSRLGRDTLQVLAAIDMLNKAKVSLYIMNYNIETLTPDGKVNPMSQFMITLLAEVARMERRTIKERMARPDTAKVMRTFELNIKMCFVCWAKGLVFETSVKLPVCL